MPFCHVLKETKTNSSNSYVNNGVVEVVCPPPQPSKPLPKPRPKPATPSDEEEEQVFIQQPPIRVEDLAKYIHTKELAGDNGFKADYKVKGY